jgi:hypothetical protein
VIKLAVGTPGGRWQQTTLNPPAGADLLLPALGLLSPGDVRLLCAVHTRLGDRLGYDWAGITVTGQGPSVSSPGLAALTQAPTGPGFFEIGEELALARTQGGLLTALVVAGQDGAALETATFSAPPAATAPPRNTGTPASRTPSPGAPGTSGPAAPGASTARAASDRPHGFATTAAWLAAAALCCAVAAVAAVALLLRRRRRGTARPARHRPPGHRRR